MASRDAAVASMGAASFGAAAWNGCGGGARGSLSSSLNCE